MNTLILHNTTLNDIDKFITLENESENKQFITPNTKEEHLKNIKNKDIKYFTIKNNTSFVGFVILVGLLNTDNHIELRRIVISKKGNGYGKISLQKIKEFCFTKLHCKKLWLDVFEYNTIAFNLYKSEGFKVEKTLNNYIIQNGSYQNLIIMSISKHQYLKAHFKQSNF